MRIRWTEPAANDLADIRDYLQEHFPQFAEPTIEIAERAGIIERNRFAMRFGAIAPR